MIERKKAEKIKIKLKRIEKSGKRHIRVGVYHVDKETKIRSLKEIISAHLMLEKQYFHLESYIESCKILLTDSFPLSFFFTTQSAVVFFETHSLMQEHEPQRDIVQECATAAINGNYLIVSEFLTIKSYDIMNRKHSNGWSIIHYASSYGHERIVQLLIDSGCNINQETDDFWTPLLIACAHGQTSCVCILLKAESIQINKMTKRGTALHIAVKYSRIDIVALLLKDRACSILEDYTGKIPLEVANDPEIIDLIPQFEGNWLLEKYSDKNKPPSFGGNVIRYNLFSLSDKYIYLHINLDLGFLEEYPTKDAYMKRNTPLISHRILDFQHVGPSKSGIFVKNNFCFEIILSTTKKYYYTKYEEYRDNWIHQICLAVNYCQIHKIGENSGIEDRGEEDDEYVALEENNSSVLKNFEKLEEIGAGSYGIVYKVMKIDTQETFAMKCLSKVYLKKKSMLKYAISEIKIMQQLSHTFVIKLHYAFETKSCIYLILDYCEGGDIEHLVSSRLISQESIKYYIAEIILGLEHIHNLDILYRDLKPANILIDSDGHLKLADFGLARNFSSEDSIVSTLVGSPGYISPEILCRETLLAASDIYSLGVVIHEMLTGRLPYSEVEFDLLFAKIKAGKFCIDKNLNNEAKDLINKMMNRNPKKRPNFDIIKRHEFFKGISWETVANRGYSFKKSKWNQIID